MLGTRRRRGRALARSRRAAHRQRAICRREQELWRDDAAPAPCEGVGQDAAPAICRQGRRKRSEEHTSELQSLMRISYAVFCLKKKNSNKNLKQYNNSELTETHAYNNKTQHM